MSATGFPWLAMWAGIGFVFIYSMGERLETAYGNHLKNIGLIGAAFLLFYWFTAYCPAAATRMALHLLMAAVGFKALLWFIFKLKDDSPSPPAKTEDQSLSSPANHQRPDDIYEKTIRARREEKFGSRPAGFEHSEARQRHSQDGA